MTYAALKELVTRKNLTWQYHERADSYEVFVWDAGERYSTTIYKANTLVGGLNFEEEATNRTDFETNHKPNANWAIGQRPYPFATGDFEFQGTGEMLVVTAGTTQNLDVLVSQDLYVNGGEVYAENAVVGDYIVCRVIDKDNVLGTGIPNLVVKQWINKWYVVPNALQKLRTPYAGKIPAGLYMRVTYTSVGQTDVKVIGNYNFHKAI